MFADNEVGSLNPISEIATICQDANVAIHTDATQAVGKVPIDLAKLPIDLLSLSGHKLYGPKGIGALFVRRKSPRLKLTPVLFGGGHESGFRSGTLPVHQIVGLGAACELCTKNMEEETPQLESLCQRMETAIKERIIGTRFNGQLANKLPGNLHVTFSGVNSDALMNEVKDVVSLSSGSACTTADPEPSHVLLAMGLPDEEIESSIRIGLGRFNDAAAVSYTHLTLPTKRIV